MSEQLLKALMELFAIISKPDSIPEERSKVVRSFLNRQLNRELVEDYLKVFDTEFQKVMKEDKKAKNPERLIARRSVKVLVLCERVKDGLTQSQRVVVLFQLLEFIKSESQDTSNQEMEYVKIVAVSFGLRKERESSQEIEEIEDFDLIREFVLNDESLQDHPQYLVINNTQKGDDKELTKHIYGEGLEGQINFIQVKNAGMYFLKYVGKGELQMNGQLLENGKSYPFNMGSNLKFKQVKLVYYSDVVSQFKEDEVKSKIVFEASHITYRFPNGAIGLHDVGFIEQSGRLVGIMGASGAGKSTLLNVLNGVSSPSEGKVLINGMDIHSKDPSIEGIIGFVSQDDLLIEELTVYQNLYYNAKLCFENYSEEKLVETVDRTLESLGLLEKKNIQVGSPLNKKISGGQRKRLNIALELIREPAVLFLDEPTSGLSSRDSENILDLLKELTFKGKLIFVVIHQPSSDIFKMFDRLLILDTGGYLIYNGNPVHSVEYFKDKISAADAAESECPTCGNVNPEQVFNIIETSVLDEFGQLTNTRKLSPTEWSEFFKNENSESSQDSAGKEDLPEISFKIPGRLKQFGIFIKRDILKKLKDTQYLAINFGEAPLLAFILAYIIRYFNQDISNVSGYTLSENMNMPVYIFMSVIVAFFMGLTGSAEEIIKDRKILKREAFLNLSWSGYLMSKVSVQFLISAIQALTFVLVGNSIMGIRGFYFEYWLVLFSVWTAANMRGLLISDSFKTVVTIYILIPILVIPQIILSGIIVKYEELNPHISSPKRIPVYGEVITARWAYEGLATYQFLNNDYEIRFKDHKKLRSIGNYKANIQTRELINKLDLIERHLDNAEKTEDISYYLALIRNEIRDEYTERMILSSYLPETPGYILSTDELVPESINQEVIDKTREYLETLQEFYREVYRTGRQEVESIIASLEKEEQLALINRYTNERLEEFVTNNQTTHTFTEYKKKQDILQKRDPIYLDPTHPFIKAHFYAPRKQVFGTFMDTIWVNIIVIWVMTLLFYAALYFRVLKRILDRFEQFGKK